MANNEFKYIWAERHNVLYRVELSVLYHLRRERFFDLCDKFAKVVSVVGGTAVIAQVLSPTILTAVAVLITVSSAVSLVFSLSDKAKRHSDLAKNFRRLEGEILGRGAKTFTDMDVATWNSKIRELEAGEPGRLATLVVLCQNELAIAQSQPERVATVSLLKRLLAHLI